MNGTALIGILAAVAILAVIYIVSDRDSAWPRISFVVAGIIGLVALDLPWPATVSILGFLGIVWAARRAFDQSVDSVFPWEILAEHTKRGLGDDWQEHYGGDASSGNWGGGRHAHSEPGYRAKSRANARTNGSPRWAGSVDHEQALYVLGLDEFATDRDIKRAHHRLMKSHHPDRGGSTEVAIQLNRARELLLRR